MKNRLGQTMKEPVYLGKFDTSGTLIVSDPSYSRASPGLNKTLKVKPGTYKVYVTHGRLKSPPSITLSGSDSVPEFFRNSRLLIIHESESQKQNYSKTRGHISVDSGQAGFFDLPHYLKNFKDPVELIGHPYSQCLESFILDSQKIQKSVEALRTTTKDPYFNLIKDVRKFTTAKAKSHISTELKMARKAKKENFRSLATKQFPLRFKPEFSKNFYDVICDLTSREHKADVFANGSVSSTGIGDGTYNLFISKNKKGEIISSYIEFLEPGDLK